MMVLMVYITLLLTFATCTLSLATSVVEPKVFIINYFSFEASGVVGTFDSWVSVLHLSVSVYLPGLSPLFPAVLCNKAGSICMMTCGEGLVNAGASSTALFLTSKFNLKKTYFLCAGIAGGNPAYVTTGSAAFAHYAVQVDLQYELDAREMPKDWKTGYWAYGQVKPGVYPAAYDIYGTEVFELNPNLLKRVLEVTKDVKLMDNAAAQADRLPYKGTVGGNPPAITTCDVASGDVYFGGQLLAKSVGDYVSLLTHKKGHYCTTAQEDNAVLEAAVRAHKAGLVDYFRFIALRTVSDFDRQAKGKNAYKSFIYINLQASGDFPISIANLIVAGKPVVDDILTHWDKVYKNGVAPPKGIKADILGTVVSK